MEIIDKFNKNDVDASFIKEIAVSNNVNFKYINNDLSRVLFYRNNNRETTNILNRYANGMIIENVEGVWKIVCFPLQNFTGNKYYKVGEFVVFPIYDGTIINVYYSLQLKQWCYGTKKSFNIYNETWRGVKYSDIININTSELNIENTYIYVITDPKIQLWAEKAETRIICISNINSIEYTDIIDISVAEAMRNKNNALKIYDETRGANKIYGYILRNENTSFIFKSSLFYILAKVLYKPLYINNSSKKQQILYNNDMKYVIARAYLYFRYDAIKYFPMFKEQFKLMRQRYENLCKYVMFCNNMVNKVDNLTELELQLYKSVYEKHSRSIIKIIKSNNNCKSALSKFFFSLKDIDFTAI